MKHTKNIPHDIGSVDIIYAKMGYKQKRVLITYVEHACIVQTHIHNTHERRGAQKRRQLMFVIVDEKAGEWKKPQNLKLRKLLNDKYFLWCICVYLCCVNDELYDSNADIIL